MQLISSCFPQCNDFLFLYYILEYEEYDLYDFNEKLYIRVVPYPAPEGSTMMKEMKFYGSTTVGERGQIVLPAKLRDDFKIKKGDKLLVIGNAKQYRIALVNPEAMSQHLEQISQQINKMKSTIQKK
jgi:AbrB family looped-hinge helix DNA binding protein